MTWEATAKRVEPDFFARHSVSRTLGLDRSSAGGCRPPHPSAALRHARPIATCRSSGTRLSPASARGCRRSTIPTSGEFYTSGRASNEAAFLYQLFAREFGTNNFPDCSNMCHEATSVGLPVLDRRRQGNGDARGLRRVRCDLLHRPQSRHQPSAHADHAARGVAARRADRRLQSDARARARTLQVAPAPGRDARPRRRDADRVRISSGQGRRRRGDAEGHDEGGARRRRRRTLDALHLRAHKRLRGPSRRHRGDQLGGDRAPIGPHPRRDREHGGGLYQGRARHPLLRHGHHPAPPRHRECPADRQSAFAARQYRQARRRHLPVARPSQCAGRPHRRHHRDSQRRAARSASRRRSVSRRRASMATTPWSRSPRCATAIRRAFIALGGNLAVAMSDPEACFAAIRNLRPVGAHRHQAQPHPPAASPRRRSILPCLGRTEQRHAGDRPAIGDGRRLDVDGPRLARQAQARLARSAFGARDRRRHRQGDAARHQGRLGRTDRQLRPYPRQDRDRLPGFPGLQHAHPHARRLPPDHRRRDAHLEHARRQGAIPALLRHRRG